MKMQDVTDRLHWVLAAAVFLAAPAAGQERKPEDVLSAIVGVQAKI